MVESDELSLVFAALASPTRRGILDRLAVQDVTAGSLAAPFSISGAAVSQHLAVLERAGLVVRTPRAQWREVSLRAAPLDIAATWVDRVRLDWLQRFDRLDRRIAELNEQAAPGDRRATDAD